MAKKRGRPGLLSDEQQKQICDYLDVDGKRNIQNAHYRQRTVVLLMKPATEEYRVEKKFHFIFEGDSSKRNSVFKMVILSELGRIKNDEDLIFAAEEVCKHKLTTREAVAYIRQFRGVVTSKANALDLFVHLGKAVEDYQIIHPDVTKEDLTRALEFFDESPAAAYY